MKYLLTITTLYVLLSMSQAWSVPKCSGSYWDNCYGTYTWDDGAKYVGEYKDGKIHGQGTYTNAVGNVWQGQWKNDDWVSGEYYTAGEYETKLKAERRIKLKEEFKAKFKAEREAKLKAAKELKKQKEDALVKQRTLELKNELKQKKLRLKAAGEYNPSSQVSSLPPCAGSNWNSCYGTYTFANGDIYVGEWKDDKSHGQGTSTYPNGDKYVGEFKDGSRNGQGTYTHADGSKYVGEFSE